MYTHTYTPAPCTDYLPSGSCVGQLYPQQASFSNSAEHYLKHIDELMNQTQATYASQPFDLVSAVFANQAAKHQMTSYQLVWLIYERKVLAERHKRDIQHRLGEMFEARSITKMLNPADDGRRLNTVERQIIDLERQEHDAELGLWKDTLELRTQLLEERTEYQATRRRINLLSGGQYGRV